VAANSSPAIPQVDVRKRITGKNVRKAALSDRRLRCLDSFLTAGKEGHEEHEEHEELPLQMIERASEVEIVARSPTPELFQSFAFQVRHVEPSMPTDPFMSFTLFMSFLFGC
jgi:hypothetical protein